MLVVIAVILIILALVVPAFTSRLAAGNVIQSAYSLAATLEQARAYAMANSTYVWVGFYEEDGSRASTNPATTGVGRVVLSVVASRDGTRYSGTTAGAPAAFGAAGSTNQVALVQINKLVRLDNTHLAGINDNQSSASSTNQPIRPPVPLAYQVGDAPAAGSQPNNTAGAFAQTTQSPNGNTTTFTYPVPPSATQTAPSPQYTFAKIVEFDPQGEASKITENTLAGAGPQNWLEAAIQPTHGGTIDPNYTGTHQGLAAAAILIEGLSGRTQMFRP